MLPFLLGNLNLSHHFLELNLDVLFVRDLNIGDMVVCDPKFAVFNVEILPPCLLGT